jgi:hypothetical protein
LIKTLRQLHVRSELQFPPPEAGKVGRPCKCTTLTLTTHP